MKIGFIGLGKMGGQMVTRLLADEHHVVVRDLSTVAVAQSVAQGAIAATDRQTLIAALSTPFVVWLMIPADFIDEELKALAPLLPPNSIVVDGGNSNFTLTQARAELLAKKSIQLVDVGTSGGLMGLKEGFCMMVGGDQAAYQTIEPLLKSLAQPGGYGYFGSSGAGHFIKMVHNGIEYGAMEAYAEGYRLMKEGPYASLDLAAVAQLWQHGSIINSNLNGIIGTVLSANSNMDKVDGAVAENGEGKWTVDYAKSKDIQLPVIEASLAIRAASRAGQKHFGTKLLAAMRNAFGGHNLNG